MKSTTLIKSGQGKQHDKLGEGDLVFAFQVNRVPEPKSPEQYRLETNLDWSFDEEVNPIEIKSALGSFLTTVDQIFGEKMVTEMITHYADETNKLAKVPGGKVAYIRSRGLEFKK